jgi:hypothetical protein
VHEAYFVEHCWRVYQTQRSKQVSSPWNLMVLIFNVKILKLTQTKRLPNPVLRPSGAKVGGKTKNKKYPCPQPW